MKKVLTIALLAISFAGNAQKRDSTKAETKIEQLQTKVGVVLKKEFYDVASIKSLKIQVLKITEISSGKLTTGVLFSLNTGGLYSSTTTTAYLDADEIDDLINFFKTTSSLQSNTTTYTEYNFSSRGDMKAYAFADPNKDWQYGIDVDKYRSGTSVFFRQKDVADVIGAFQDAQKMLQ